MDITKRTAPALPVPLYASTVIADAFHKSDRFLITFGLNQEVVAQLKTYSLDTTDSAIQTETSDRKRFGEGSYEAWYAKDRVPFALIEEKTGTLAAVIWFGPEPFTDAPPLEPGRQWHTVAHRSYGRFRGAGLMKAFEDFAISEYLALRPGARLWGAIHKSNLASIALAGKLGFKHLSTAAEATSNQFVMVKE